MKTIIAGGRNYQLTGDDYNRLMELPITEVVSGGANGADKCGEIYAEISNLPCTVFPADWKQYGKRAGHLRNTEMAEYAEAVVLFPGGKGTQNMFEQAQEYKLKIFDFREKE